MPTTWTVVSVSGSWSADPFPTLLSLLTETGVPILTESGMELWADGIEFAWTSQSATSTTWTVI